RGAAADDPGILERDHGVADQSHDPADWAREKHTTAVPAHRLAELDSGDNLRQLFSQHVNGGPAHCLDQRGGVLPALDLVRLDSADRNALLAGEALGD